MKFLSVESSNQRLLADLKELENGTLFISDSHYPHFGDELIEILKAIHQEKLNVPQLILVGDIFDLLFGCGDYIKSFSERAIELINLISQDVEVIYLEGNHDFYLRKIFKNIEIYPREKQPTLFKLKDKTVAISHGDKFEMGLMYEIYTFLIRHPTTLRVLKLAEKFIVDKNIKRLMSKNICKEFSNFEKRVEKIVSKYQNSINLIIEGHYHQGIKVGKYISLPSLVCQKSVAVVKDGETVFISIEELLRAKN